jgi:hypothetical protein
MAAYRGEIKEQLQQLKRAEIQKVIVDLSKIKMKALAIDVGVLAESKKLFMKFDNGRYYPLNDRTIDLLLKGQIDTTAEVEYHEGQQEQNTKHHTSDAEMAQLAETTKKV